MELGTIEREVYIEASPEVVFEVVSSPDHLTGWWPAEARYELTPGSNGQIAFAGQDTERAEAGQAEPVQDGQDGTERDAGGATGFTVVEVLPPRTFSFRWTHPVGSVATEGTSLLVTFDLTPSGDGTLLRMTETGFREMGWETAVLEHQYREHLAGWDHFLPRIAPYVATLGARR